MNKDRLLSENAVYFGWYSNLTQILIQLYSIKDKKTKEKLMKECTELQTTLLNKWQKKEPITNKSNLRFLKELETFCYKFFDIRDI